MLYVVLSYTMAIYSNVDIISSLFSFQYCVTNFTSLLKLRLINHLHLINRDYGNLERLKSNSMYLISFFFFQSHAFYYLIGYDWKKNLTWYNRIHWRWSNKYKWKNIQWAESEQTDFHSFVANLTLVNITLTPSSMPSNGHF